jgi:hypothetical protein
MASNYISVFKHATSIGETVRNTDGKWGAMQDPGVPSEPLYPVVPEVRPPRNASVMRAKIFSAS